MDHDPVARLSPNDHRFDDVWRENRDFLLGMAARMLGDRAEAEDVIQDAFGRLMRIDLEEIDEPRGWLTVVVRRLCLDRIRSAHTRHESAAGASIPEGDSPVQARRATDPADRVTLDDQVQLALAVVLDRLSPAERTAFVLHDVFGFPFDAVAEIVGRTPTACRQLASRARRSIRTEADPVRPKAQNAEQRALAERFIAACAGGDITELMAVLDADIEGDARLLHHGPLVHVAGRPAVAQRLLGMFGPGTDTTLVPVGIEGSAGVVAYMHGRVAAVIRLDASNGLIHHIQSFVSPPLPGGQRSATNG